MVGMLENKVREWLEATTAVRALITAPMTGEADTIKQIERAKRKAKTEAYHAARALLMSGPRATPPRHKTVMRFMRQHQQGIPIDRGSRIRVREPANNGAGFMTHLLHPTKGYR